MNLNFNDIKMKLTPTFILIALFFLSSKKVISQDLHYSNVLKSTPIYSIGSIGSDEAYVRATSLYRNQWPTVGKSFTTYGLNVDGKIDLNNKNSLGLGFISNRDQAGDLSLTKLQVEVAVVYSQQITRQSYLSGGIQGGFIQHSIDGTEAKWQNQINGKEFNPTISSGEEPFFQPFMNYTLGAGLRWKYANNQAQSGGLSNLQFGLSMYHIANSPIDYLSSEKDKVRVVFSGSSSISLNQSKIEPAFVYQQKGKETEFVIGAMYKYIILRGSRQKSYSDGIDISAGAFFRLPNDAIIPTVNFSYENFTIGIAYDINISPLIQASNSIGGIEFYLQFVW